MADYSGRCVYCRLCSYRWKKLHIVKKKCVIPLVLVFVWVLCLAFTLIHRYTNNYIHVHVTGHVRVVQAGPTVSYLFRSSRGDTGVDIAPHANRKTLHHASDPSINSLDLQRFQNLLHDWQPDKPKAAIHILVRNTNRNLGHLEKTLTNLNDHFMKQFNYPLILFYDENESEVPSVITERYLGGIDKDVVFFQAISMQVPDKLLPVPDWRNMSCSGSVGYRGMCRFHAYYIYTQPIFRNLTWLWRLDDDSFIMKRIDYDVFKYMEVNEYVYGYVQTDVDMLSCVKDLWEKTDEYIAVHKIQPTFFRDWQKPNIYYNNFELSRKDFWLGDAYSNYFHFIDGLGGIYTNRWGDAPIKTLGLSLFLPINRVHCFTDIASFYYHQYTPFFVKHLKYVIWATCSLLIFAVLVRFCIVTKRYP